MQMNKIYRSFFIKNLVTFLLPMLIPLLILGSLSTFLIQQYVKEQINADNMNLLKQTKENTELIFNELDSLNLYIVASATEFMNLQNMLSKSLLEKEDYKELASLKNFIDSPNIARPYIDSIYIYIANEQERFLTSTTGGLMEVSEFYDRSWYRSYKEQKDEELIWTEARTVHKTYYEGPPSTSTNLITMYRKMPIEQDGVIVLNIKTDYLEDYLASLSTTKDQGLLIVDKDQNVLFQNQQIDVKKLDMNEIISNRQSTFSMKLGEETYIVSRLFSEKFDWTFISISPKSSLYQAPKRLSSLALVLSGLSIIGGTALAYYFTRKKNLEIKHIIHILQTAEKGTSLPPPPSKIKDVYGYIIHSMLKNFMEHNHVKIQLSERKYKEQAMEFAALHSQLNPHFLFNTLETINWKAISLTGRPNEVNSMIGNLADILRYSLDGENKMVHLKQEITYTLSYIEIQKSRYQDKFDVSWDYNENELRFPVMKLILQPLLENSLSHGMKQEDICLIKIKIRVSANLLKISVIDNGMGISPERLHQVRTNLESNTEQTTHIGLYNTHKRIKLTYGEPFGIIIRSKLGWGTAIHLVIPKN